jgi:sialate O-acetylesterase
MSRQKQLQRLAALIALVGTMAKADIRTPSILSANMVLQRERPVPVWGWAEPGERITVEFAGQQKEATAAAEDGRWRISLDPLAASVEPRAMTICGDRSDRPVQYDNILVGEVWVLAGQSNMGWPLGKSAGAAAARERANYPWLRVFSQWPNQGASDTPAPDVKGGRWSVCSPANAESISGVGFFFAESLYPDLRVPIALVNTAMGGTWIESWIDPPTLQTLPGARPYLEQIALARGEVEAGKKTLEQSMLGAYAFRRPGALYFGKVTPLQPFALRGVLWYQGEGNANPRMAPYYRDMLSALIARWRSDWSQGEFPFLIVQLPGYGDNILASGWPLLREMQLKVSREIPNTGLVVTIDTGERDTIHPAEKQPVGARAARLARALVYGAAIEGTGPQLEGHEIQGAAMTLRFSRVGSGLKCGGQTLQGFEIAGATRRFVTARARITAADIVSVWSPEVPQPVAVRYAWKAFPECNLLGGDALPASPARTDEINAIAAGSSR